MRGIFTVIVTLLLAPWSVAHAQEVAGTAPASPSETPAEFIMPAVLSLPAALEIAELSGAPDLEIAEAGILRSLAEYDEVRATKGLRSRAEAFPRRVVTAGSQGDEFVDDTYYTFRNEWLLSDFGRTSRRAAAAQNEIQAQSMQYMDAANRLRLRIMQAYFNVLLADRQYTADDEAMTVKYLTYDRLRERHELGEVADVDLLGLESAYREALVVRAHSANRRSEARAELAALLNHPESLPGDLAPVEAALDEIEVPEYQPLLEQVKTNNPELVALKEKVKAVEAKLEASRMFHQPYIDTLLEYGNYEREFGTRDKWRVGVQVLVPIWNGGRDRAEAARLVADLQEAQARQRLMETDLHRTVLELVQELEALKVAWQSAKTRLEFRDLYLDRSRSLYELEVKTDLGDASAKMSEAQWAADQTRFDLLLTLASIDALLGEDPARRILEMSQ